MKLTRELTSEKVNLIRALRIRRFGDSKCGVDKYDMYGGTYLYEDMAYILGLQDKLIPESREDVFGPKYEAETQAHLEELAADLDEHLIDYEEILHQFCTEGLRLGKYTCLDNERLWKYVEETTNGK